MQPMLTPTTMPGRSAPAPDRPLLIEAGTTDSLRLALRECRARRHKIVSFIVNVALVLGLGFMVWSVLSYRREHRLSPEMRERKAQIAKGDLFAMLGRHDRRMNNQNTW
jgi:hypothetical protein